MIAKQLLAIRLPSSIYYLTHFSWQFNCWSLRCSWSIVCRRCSNSIFILNLTPGFNGLGKDKYKMRREAIKFWGLVRLILDTLRYVSHIYYMKSFGFIHIQPKEVHSRDRLSLIDIIHVIIFKERLIKSKALQSWNDINIYESDMLQLRFMLF